MMRGAAEFYGAAAESATKWASSGFRARPFDFMEKVFGNTAQLQDFIMFCRCAWRSARCRSNESGHKTSLRRNTKTPGPAASSP